MCQIFELDYSLVRGGDTSRVNIARRRRCAAACLNPTQVRATIARPLRAIEGRTSAAEKQQKKPTGRLR
jgi:hypothetical protein